MSYEHHISTMEYIKQVDPNYTSIVQAANNQIKNRNKKQRQKKAKMVKEPTTQVNKPITIEPNYFTVKQ